MLKAVHDLLEYQPVTPSVSVRITFLIHIYVKYYYTGIDNTRVKEQFRFCGLSERLPMAFCEVACARFAINAG